MATTIQDRREQFHLARLTDYLGPLNSHVNDYMVKAHVFYVQKTGDVARSLQLGVQSLDDLRQQQALSMAYFDVFFLCGALSAVLVVLVLLMKRSVAEPGEHIGGE
jgi:DHA2 family multidrug resistance protein